MEFNFNINLYFKSEITKVGSRLVPSGFSGDRRELQECISRMSLLVTILGENSAKAQGLQKVITSGERLRNSDHVVYVLVDQNGGTRGNGTVLGMLKTGVKHLYVFDASGNNHEVSANCVLDFYVHESVQRMGLGKKLFEYMLQEENVIPQHLAIDKPSPKFLSFLHKHYGLKTIIPQMNNFVLFEGFFTNRPKDGRNGSRDRMMAAGISSSVLRSLSGSFGVSPVHEQTPSTPEPTPSAGVTPLTPFGRPAAHRPVSTMGLILQHHAPAQGPSPGASRSNSIAATTPAESNMTDEVEETEILEVAIEELQIEPEKEAAEEPRDEKEEDAASEDQSLPNPEQPETPLEPLPCKIQAATVPHLDLKFYHSSLW